MSVLSEMDRFIRARLREEDSAAMGTMSTPSGPKAQWKISPSGDVVDGAGSVVISHEGGVSRARNRHIVGNDPWRTLARTKALGRLFAFTVEDPLALDGGEVYADQIKRCLASIWRDHPDYQQEWKP